MIPYVIINPTHGIFLLKEVPGRSVKQAMYF